MTQSTQPLTATAHNVENVVYRCGTCDKPIKTGCYCSQKCADSDDADAYDRQPDAKPDAASYVAPHRCEWTENDEGVWSTACGQMWCFEADPSPTAHGMKFCHACGGNLKEAAYSFRESEADDDGEIDDE